MRFIPARQDHEAQYACDEDHHRPLRVPTDIADQLMIGSILEAVFTDEALSTIEETIIEEDQEKNTPCTFTIENLTLLREDPQFFLQTLRTSEKAKNFLGTFITRINLFPDRAVVHYTMPLPSHNHLAGATEQEVLLSAKLN